jgi:polar amino acid transport system substrate-binding protein
MQRRKWILAALAAGAGIGNTGCAGVARADDPPLVAARSALAPDGRLRVGFLASPLYATRAAGTGELSGVAVDLGRELASRLGVPFEPVVYAGVPALLAGGRTGEWDVVLTGITAERAATLDFTAAYLEVEWGYLARAGSSLGDAGSIDRVGVRVGVVERASADPLLSASLKHASLVRAASVAELYAVLDSGRADVVAATKATLFSAARERAGARVLEGRILVEPIGMAVPKGRDPAATRFLTAFVEKAKRDGLVARTIERAGLRGVGVAPLA